MRTLLTVPLAVALLGACTSSTTIHSNVPARVFLNGQYVGTTPYTMSDTKTVGSTTTVRLEAPGYEPVMGSISRNEEFSVGACIGGVFLLVPFLWIMDYAPTHGYELRPAGQAPGPAAPYPAPAPPPPPPGGYR